MTVRASSFGGCDNGHPAGAAGPPRPEERDALERQGHRPSPRETRLSARGDQDRILILQGLLHLDHVVGAPEPKALTEAFLAGRSGAPNPSAPGDEETRSLQGDSGPGACN